MIQLIYCSQSVEPFSQKQLTNLLTRARANNEALGITGMLVHHRDRFLQVLEGGEATIERLYSVIALDRRHRNVAELARCQITERNFADWSMGFFNADVEALSQIPGFADFFGRGFSRAAFVRDPSLAKKMLLNFRDGRLAVATC